MKRCLLALLLATALGCSRERIPSLTGQWTIVETNAGTGGGFVKTTFRPASEISVRFYSNGTLTTAGPNPGTSRSELWKYHRYQLLSDNMIRLTNSNTTDTTTAHTVFEGGLSLWYSWARCGYEEKFVRLP